MAQKARPDLFLLVLVVILVVLGVAMIYSASAFVSIKAHETPYYFLQRQALWAIVGGAALWTGLLVDYRNYRRAAPLVALLTLVLLVAVLVPPLGTVLGGVRRWVQLGPVRFQPSELAKIGLVIYLARELVEKRERLQTELMPLRGGLVFLALCLLLIMFEPDLGTAVALGASLAAMLFIGGLKKRTLAGAALFTLPAIVYSLALHPYQRERVMTFWDPWKDPLGGGFQIIQSFLALGRGGLLGMGPAAGRQKLFFLPAPHTDFVLAIIGEELGFAGLALVLLLFAMVLWRGMRVALRAPDLYGTYLAFGLTFCLFLQVILNAGVVAGLLPTKGLTLPFLSYGGTSLVVSMASVGILLNISQYAVTPPGDAA